MEEKENQFHYDLLNAGDQERRQEILDAMNDFSVVGKTFRKQGLYSKYHETAMHIKY